ASILSSAARRTRPGESTSALVIARLSSPSCARCVAPRLARSPTPTTLTDVMPIGLRSARKRRSTAASSVSGTECPPPDPLIKIASPSCTRRAASYALIFSITLQIFPANDALLLDAETFDAKPHDIAGLQELRRLHS